MIKPRKKRNVLFPPGAGYFKPHGYITDTREEVILAIDEYEAIRLADHQNLKQEDAAKKMNISRPTFTRLVDSARKKIAKALVKGQPIRIAGGSFIFLKNRVRCQDCGHIWDTGPVVDKGIICPLCGSPRVTDMGAGFMKGAMQRRHRGKRWR